MKLLLPNEILPQVTDVDLERLNENGIRGLLFDLDNTLVGYDSEELAAEFITWIKKVKQNGFKVCLVSNGKPRRVRRFAKIMGMPAIIRAFKPKRSPFWRALQILDLKPHQVVMIGDQLFTDVLGANRIGIYTILITPLSEKELKTTRVVRKLEQRMLLKFVKKGMITSEALIQRNGGK